MVCLQLYGLEILSSNASSFSSIEKKATLERLRTAYHSIQDQTSILKANSEYMRVFHEVGEKLCILELQEDDYEAFAKDVVVAGTSQELLDPLEKVAHWQKDHQNGSGSTSPTAQLVPQNSVAKHSERSSFEQGSPSGDLDSGCPGSERSPSTQLNNLIMTRNLSHVEEVLTPTSGDDQEADLNTDLTPRKSDLDGLLEVSSSLTTPRRGTHAILASQIDQEIQSLRNFFEDHREEMLSLISTNEKTKVPMTSAGCSPIVFDTNKSPKRCSSAKKKNSKRWSSNALISDTSEETVPDVQEERRQEFEKFRYQKKLKRRSNNGQQSPAQVGQHQPVSSPSAASNDMKISALFPKVDQEAGRHVSTVDGDQVFIPKLNLEDQWSMPEDQVDKISFEQTKYEDKSCQASILPKYHAQKKAKKKKSKVS